MHSPEPRTSMQGGEMDVLDRVKEAAGQATTKAQQSVATLQTKRKLTHAYGELGQTTFELVQSGELTHPRVSRRSSGSAPSRRSSSVRSARKDRPRRPPRPGRHRNRRRCRPSSGTSVQQPSEAETGYCLGQTWQRRRGGQTVSRACSLEGRATFGVEGRAAEACRSTSRSGGLTLPEAPASP